MRRILVTRASGQAGSLEAALRDLGLEPVAVPTIAVEIDPPGGELDAAVRALPRFEWVVVTSPNGARAVLAAAERVPTSLSTPRWAAIGEGTARLLEREDVQLDFEPSRPTAAALADELPMTRGDRVLLLRGNLAGAELPARLRARGAIVTDVVAYRTIEGPPRSRPVLHDAFTVGRPDAVLFASGSAARGLLSLARTEALPVDQIPAICIGAETEREATRLGFHVVATSPEPDPTLLAATTAAALAQPLEMR